MNARRRTGITVMHARKTSPRAAALFSEKVDLAGRRHRAGKRGGGTYALILFLPKAASIHIGALGQFCFPRGYYIYVGSAMNGLDPRIGRHLESGKRLFWHIDYFLQHARVVDVWFQESRRRLECVWARQVLALDNARVIANRFGASDCRCQAHLVQLMGAKQAKG